VRYCKTDSLHRFDTVEQRAGYKLDQVCVRQSGNGELARDPFRKSRVLQDVRASVLKRLSDAQVYEVVNAAVHDLEVHLPQLLGSLSPEEQEARPGYVGAIGDTDIADAVERNLRSSPSSMAHVLYALAIRGRSDRQGRDGWTDAPHVLSWLGKQRNYPELVSDVPEPQERPVDHWVTGSRPPRPRLVIKRNGDLADFRTDKFGPGIQRALLGRPDARLRASGVAQWVLWGLAGQSQVTTAQLGVGVLDALRRVDDIAYLRWCIVFKRIESVAAFVEEVRGLIENPSPKLVINGPSRARPEEMRRPPAA
jgi:transcriptional regulator NrdR family protein